jgi:hypothetical protein
MIDQKKAQVKAGIYQNAANMIGQPNMIDFRQPNLIAPPQQSIAPLQASLEKITFQNDSGDGDDSYESYDDY